MAELMHSISLDEADLLPMGLNDTSELEDNSSSPCCYSPDCLAPSQSFHRVFLPVVYGLVCLLGFAGNGLILVILTCFTKKRTSSDLYLMHLAAADLLFVLTMPFWAVGSATEWVFGNVLCCLVNFTFTVNLASSILLLACISIERYLAIVRATKTDKVRRKFATKVTCGAVWALSLLLAVPDLVFSHVYIAPLSGHQLCEHVYPESASELWRTSLRALHHVLAFALPGIVIVFCYVMVIRTLSQLHNHEKRKALKVVVAIVAAFFVCWLPYNVVTLLDTLMRLDAVVNSDCEMEQRLGVAVAVTEGVGFSHCCFIPVLYAFVGKKFKENLARLRGCKACVGTPVASYREGKRQSSNRPHPISSDSDFSTSTIPA
uniref:C-X-C chemokine receptor type 4 n=1 Tax=Petromyzon marinus TaxID=7757 RepID=A0AAJ7SLR9_PETMA|nr:C-X-C chemokine receptor type 4 [Petromyzon marinus]